MIKKAYTIQMSYDVTVSEKEQAQKAILCFKYTAKLLRKASDHLNIMKTSFKENPDIPPEDIMKARVSIRRYRNKSVENFNSFKSAAFKCIKIMQSFGSDTQVIKLTKSFINSIDELEEKVNSFVDLFSDLESKEFTKEVVKYIDDIQKQCKEIIDLINERVKSYILSNILASTWVDEVGNELQMKIERKNPLILQLFNRRNDQINTAIKERNNNVQS
jgi:hypothetical protein